jgi:hypothetical protein
MSSAKQTDGRKPASTPLDQEQSRTKAGPKLPFGMFDPHFPILIVKDGAPHQVRTREHMWSGY